MDPIGGSKDDKHVQQYPMLAGFERVAVNQEEDKEIIKGLSVKELQESSINLRSIEGVSNQNAEKLKQHDTTLKRWNDNVETAQAMCAEKLDKNCNEKLNSAIKNDDTITFDSTKGIFTYNSNGKTAKFKVIQGSNGKHLLQITIVGRLSKDELESRIEEIVDELSKYGTIEYPKLPGEQTSEKRTLKLPNGTEIILPSNMDGKPRANFKVEHNKIHFQGDQYRNDMASVFGKDNIPVNVKEGFSVNNMSNDVWRNDCMRQVKSMISPMVELGERYGKFLDSKKIKAPVNCLFELLSMNMMLNSVLGSQSKQHEEILKISGSLSLATKQDTGDVSICGSAATEITEDSFESWKMTLESIHAAYDKFTKDIENITRKNKTSTTFVAEEAVLRQHEVLLRELFVEAANRASDVLKIDISLAKGNIGTLVKKEIADMEFPSASGIMSNVIEMFVQKHVDKLELEKKEHERKEKEEKSQQEIADLRKDVRCLSESVAERNAKIDELTKKIEELEAQIEDLQEKSVQPMAGSDSSGSMNVNPVNSIGGVGYMQPIGDDMNERVKELEKLCEEQKRQLDEQQKEIERLKYELERMQVDRDELDRLRREMEKAKLADQQGSDGLIEAKEQLAGLGDNYFDVSDDSDDEY